MVVIAFVVVCVSSILCIVCICGFLLMELVSNEVPHWDHWESSMHSLQVPSLRSQRMLEGRGAKHLPYRPETQEGRSGGLVPENLLGIAAKSLPKVSRPRPGAEILEE